MNGNRVIRIHTFSPQASVIPMRSFLQSTELRRHFTSPGLGSAWEEPQIRGLDYCGRRRAGETGGGFFDFVSRPGANLAVCMGAAPVPGTGSALMVSSLENILCNLSVQTEAKPSAIMQTVNRAICAAPGDNSYATVFFASVDPLQRQLCYVNAGHEPALLFRKRHNRAILLESTGAILGLSDRSSYGQRTIPLEPGDLLAVFSDSVAEAVDGLGRPFGSAGALAVLRRSASAHAADVVEEILCAAERHAGWGVPAADQTVAVVRFTGGTAEAIPDEVGAELAFAAA